MSYFDGPLKICPQNPRYFTNNTGKAIYLTRQEPSTSSG